MGLLAAVAYEPATAVTNKNTTAALALTAFDTTNLRVTFTVPASGVVMWSCRGIVHGGTAAPMLRIGVLEGSTVRGTVVPSLDVAGTIAATTMIPFVAERPVTGLTPSASLTWDLAYAVETLVASSAIKYGGPNNTTANDSFGALTFMVWDPM